jgi:hypothetical protein
MKILSSLEPPCAKFFTTKFFTAEATRITTLSDPTDNPMVIQQIRGQLWSYNLYGSQQVE